MCFLPHGERSVSATFFIQRSIHSVKNRIFASSTAQIPNRGTEKLDSSDDTDFNRSRSGEHDYALNLTPHTPESITLCHKKW